jgi:3-deoxy-D-manno-octulosonic acid kinase
LNISIFKSGSIFLLTPKSNERLADVATNITNDNWFEAEYWKDSQAIVGESKGRFTTWFVRAPSNISDSIWVLRHYYRGGLVAKLSRDKFFYLGLAQTRVYKEINLLVKMRQLGLPVPAPVGGRVTKGWFNYQCDLLMEKLQARDLVAVLSKTGIDSASWYQIGKVIAEFHHHGIDHSDLNAHNIMLDDAGKVWLIDFDRCSQRASSKTWQQKNIDRLKRSFDKEKMLHEQFYFDDSSWQQLLKGYRNR